MCTVNVSKVLANSTFCVNSKRLYTVIVERLVKPPMVKKGKDVRSRELKPIHYQYKLVDCVHTRKWGKIDVILTEYVEGVGHKGELISIDRHQAYYELFPLKQAVFPTEEYLNMYSTYKKDIEHKSKVSPYAIKTKEKIENIILQIPMNMSVEWNLTEDNIRIALRYNKIVSGSENIQIPKDLKINSQELKDFTVPFIIDIKINDYTTAKLKCKIVPTDIGKFWENFTAFNKTI